MSAALTPAEIETLDAAEKIIAAHTPRGASFSMSFHENGLFNSSAYFDSVHNQHMIWDCIPLSKVVANGIAIEANLERNAEKAKADRIARLKAELAELGEVAA